jgi:hypothetical protein
MADKLHQFRTILPIPDLPDMHHTMLYDAKDPGAKFPKIEPLRPPREAPNVLIVLLDDVGFAAPSAFGGPCRTPTAERLSAHGLRYRVGASDAIGGVCPAARRFAGAELCSSLS